MAGLRPAGMSDEESSDDSDEFMYGNITKKLKPSASISLTKSETTETLSEIIGPKSTSSWSLGRGRGLRNIDDEWGETVIKPKPNMCTGSDDFQSQVSGASNQKDNISTLKHLNTETLSEIIGPKSPSIWSLGRGRGRGLRNIDDDWGENVIKPKPNICTGSDDFQSQVQVSGASNQKDSISTLKHSNPVSKSSNHPCNNPNLNTIPNIDKIKAEELYRCLKFAWDAVVGEEELSKLCDSTYKNCENPFSLGLFLMIRCPDFLHPNRNKPLSVTVINELHRYTEKNKVSADSFLSSDLREAAFRLVMQQRKSSLIKMVVDIYGISQIKDNVIKSIETYCSIGQYKEACAAANALELYCFDVHDFLIPLILQDRVSNVEEYLQNEKSKEIQHKLLSFLDEITSERDVTNTLYNYMEKYKIDRAEIKLDKLNGKYLSKLVKRLATKYMIDASKFPNIKSRQKLSELRHLFGRRYDEKTHMQEDNFHELLADFIHGDSELLDEALYLMKIHGDYQSAIKFVQLCNVPQEKIPSDILERITGKSNTCNETPVEENWDEDTSSQSPLLVQNNEVIAKENYSDQSWDCSWQPKNAEAAGSPKTFYKMPLSFEKICLVASLDDVTDFCNYVKVELDKNPLIVSGFDSEWKPMQSKCASASLLQVAFNEKVFLIDLMSLKKCENQKILFDMIMKEYFANKNVLKVVYDVKNDISMLATVGPEWQNLNKELASTVDLRVVRSEIAKRNSSFFGSSVSPGGGLSELVQLCLNNCLSKGEQFSDWEKRPLRPAQKIYAATDAYCLLDVFEYLKERNKSVSVDLDSIIKICQNRNQEPTRKIKAPIEVVSCILSFKRPCETTRDEGETRFQIPVKAGNVKFLCDDMLQGLGKQLRNCGIDTTILDRTGLYDYNVIRQSKEDGKFFLTRGRNRFNEFVDEFPPGCLFYVSTDSIVDQIKEIFGHFNIIADESDSFSICQQCNSNAFISVSKEFMRNLLERKGFRNSKVLTHKAMEFFKQKTPYEMILYIRDVERSWKIFPESDIKLRISDNNSRLVPIAFTVETDATVEINKIPVHLIDFIDGFYVCRCCGVTYWDSKALENIVFAETEEKCVLAGKMTL